MLLFQAKIAWKIEKKEKKEDFSCRNVSFLHGVECLWKVTFCLLNSQDVPADFRHVQKPKPSWQDDQVKHELIKQTAVKKQQNVTDLEA